VLKQKWRLERILGIGGMAVVYAATHRTGHAVAVKVLHAELAVFEEMRARFAQEPYVANRVDHEGVVRVIDDDVADDGAPFVVMELLEGQALDSACQEKGGRLPIGEALEITDRLLDVLAAAHAAGILHRDVKPQNVFVTRAGAIKLIDFGVARAEGPGTMTRTGGIIGTPAFMPPEQARGRMELVDERSDIWAVGATLFTMLSGKYVHDAGTASEFLAAAMTPARSIVDVVPNLPTPVVDLVTRALAYDRANRWPNARAMQVETRRVKGAVLGEKTSGNVLASLVAAPNATLPLVGPGGTLFLRDSIPEWFAGRPGTIAVPPAPRAEDEPSEDIETEPRGATFETRVEDEPTGKLREKETRRAALIEKHPTGKRQAGVTPESEPTEELQAEDLEEDFSPTTDRWYVSNGAAEVGPVTLELVRRGIEAGRVPEGSLIRHETSNEWRPLPNRRKKAPSRPPPTAATTDAAVTQTAQSSPLEDDEAQAGNVAPRRLGPRLTRTAAIIIALSILLAGFVWLSIRSENSASTSPSPPPSVSGSPR
jgi:eukaryotic-like serine/threonine-protein kinase